MRATKQDVTDQELTCERNEPSSHNIKLPIKFKSEISIPEFKQMEVSEIKEKEPESLKIREVQIDKNKVKGLW